MNSKFVELGVLPAYISPGPYPEIVPGFNRPLEMPDTHKISVRDPWKRAVLNLRSCQSKIGDHDPGSSPDAQVT